MSRPAFVGRPEPAQPQRMSLPSTSRAKRPAPAQFALPLGGFDLFLGPSRVLSEFTQKCSNSPMQVS
jgi:hypothetical protein